MSKVRLFKKIGFFNEALAEMDLIEQDLNPKADQLSESDPEYEKYIKLIARMFRERMSILATVKRFDEASAAYDCMKTIQN